MSLATRLNQLRLKKAKSLQEVADAIGVSKTHIWEIEKNRSKNPSIEMLAKLADYFKVSIRYLVGEDHQSGDDPQLERMFRQVGQLSDRDRALLDTMISDMVKRKGSNED